ncbi:MAG: hypothetical protein V3S25_11420 [Nitrospirales bacterium]
MARQARWDAPGTLHLVVVRGIERRRMVDDEQDRKESPAPYCWPRALSDYKNGALALTPPATSSTRPGEARQVALYGLRRLAGLGLTAIARQMGVGYTTVSRRVAAVATRLISDARFRKRVLKLLDGKVKT